MTSTAGFRLASRQHRREDTTIELPDGTRIGGDHVAVIAGPCAVEDRGRLLADASGLRDLGVRVLRGGAFKPRTSPYSFQGLGEAGLRLLAEARERTGMRVVTEVMAVDEVMLVARHADILQVGARNMQNFRLLEALGRAGKPVLLKRGMAATVEEFLCAAEYVLAAGNPDVILCERGVRGFEPGLRGALDLGAVALVRELTHLPVIVDPSHATGRRELVAPCSLGAVAAGASGIMVEATADPAAASVDGAQTIDHGQLAGLLRTLAPVAAATGRRLDLAGDPRGDVAPVQHATTTSAA